MAAVPNASLIQEMAHCHRQQLTGALFSKSTDSRLLQVFFVNGEIQSLKYHGSSGVSAIQLIPSLSFVKTKFYPDALSRKSDELPGTKDIIRMLEAGDASHVPSSGHVSSGALAPEQTSLIENVFIEYVGPIANIIVEEALQECDTIDQLINSLAEQIESDAERNQFIESARASLS